MAFTEQGVAMLSSVLNSEKAIQVNIEIMRAFAQYRALLIESKDFRKELKALDDKINQIFRFLLEKIDALGQRQVQHPRPKIGFKIKDDDYLSFSFFSLRQLCFISLCYGLRVAS